MPEQPAHMPTTEEAYMFLYGEFPRVRTEVTRVATKLNSLERDIGVLQGKLESQQEMLLGAEAMGYQGLLTRVKAMESSIGEIAKNEAARANQIKGIIIGLTITSATGIASLVTTLLQVFAGKH